MEEMKVKDKQLYVSVEELKIYNVDTLKLLNSSYQDEVAISLIELYNQKTSKNYKYVKVICIKNGYLVIEVAPT